MTQDDRTKWMSSFKTKEALMAWLASHNVLPNQAEIDRAWAVREQALALNIQKDYKLVIIGTKHPFLKIYRRGPKRVARIKARMEAEGGEHDTNR